MWPLLFAAATAAAEPTRLLAVEAGAAVVTCVARDSAGERLPETLSGTGPWVWRPGPGETVACEAEGYEPAEIDPARAEAGRALRLELLPARTVTLEAAWPNTETRIEWRALGEAGTAAVARRRAPIGERLSLPVARAARVIRLFPTGSAPVSVLIPEGDAPLTLRLPPLRPGGELFVRWPAHAYMPASLAVVGAGGAEQPIEAGWMAGFRTATLAPGNYAVVPRYRGGLRGPGLGAVVRPGETTELFPPSHPEPGAVALSLAPEICKRDALPLGLQLRRVIADDEASPPAVFEATVAEPPCRREVEGLPFGAYEAQVGRAGERPVTLSASRFAVLPGRKTAVTLAPSVRVAGRVTFPDGSAASGLTLRFRSEGRAWSAGTDLNGDYTAVLGESGEYEISVSAAAGATSPSFTRTFQAGEQREDLRLGDTRLAVRVRRGDGARLEEAVQLVLTSRAGQRIVGSHIPTEEEAAEFTGLEHGEYVVVARTASGLTSQSAVTVRLTRQAPEAAAEVVLGRHEGRLVVVDEQGRAVPQAAASGGGRALPPTAPGVFPLQGVAAGEWLNVRAEGYTPVCHVLQEQDLTEARVVLVRPTEDLTVHAPPELAWESALLRGLPGSDCPVEIHDLGVAVQMESERTSLALRLPRGRFELVLGATASPLVAPGQDLVLSAGKAALPQP